MKRSLLLMLVPIMAACGWEHARRERRTLDTGAGDQVAIQAQAVTVSRAAAPAARPAAPPGESARDQVRIGVPDRMLIRTGAMTIRVDSIDRALARLTEVAGVVGAIVSGSNLQAGDGQHRSASAELRVRAGQFDRTMAGLRRLGVVEVENVTTEDVGEDYVDVTARIANGRRLEARLITLVATRTAKLADVVAVEHELADVRGEIESLEGRRRYLESHASLSTLTVSLHEPVTVVGIAGPGIMQQAFEQSWENFVWLVALLIRSAGVVIPVGLIALGLWSVSRKRNSPVAVR